MKNIAYILVSILILTSCIRDEIELCPSLQVNLVVKDKNYFNVDKVDQEERLSEDLAFREYVPTLYYKLREASTGRVIVEKNLFEVTGNEQEYPIIFDEDLPHGTYILTVWGNLKDYTPLDADRATATLHPGNTPGDDLYMTNDTLVYDALNYSYTAELERTKGKLILQVENLPENVNYSDKTIDGLFSNVNSVFQYTGKISVRTQAEWDKEIVIVTKTILAPSIREKGSRVDVNFYNNPQRLTPTLSPKGVNVTMARNWITVLKYVYDGSGFTIYVLVNDNWEKLHGLIVGE